MPYAIMVSTEGEGRTRHWEPTDVVFEDGAEAGAYCKLENSYYEMGHTWGPTRRYKAIKISDQDPRLWRQREEARFEDGTYQRVPWHDHYYHRGVSGTGLYEHISPDDPTKVRFIACPTDGMEGKYTSMNPGRFIKRFIEPEPPTQLLDTWCAAMGLEMTTSKLLLAKTPDEIEQVYNDGPHSCMAYKIGHPTFACVDQHPVRVYGDTDLAVAYIIRNGEITARTLCWPEKKVHGRIYGDASRLLERLKENDYIEDWNGMAGAKIRQLRNSEKELILPYIDGDLGVTIVDKDWLELTLTPHIIAKDPNGLPSADACERCGQRNVALQVYHEGGDSDNGPEYICAEGCIT